MRRIVKRVLVALALSVVCAWCAGTAWAYEKVSSEISKALGTTRGKLVSSGLVFIDGKYLQPPYRVSRVGNQIQINDRPVTGQLVAWEEFVKTQKFRVEEVAVPAKAPDGEAAPASVEDGVDPSAPKDGGNAAPAAEDGSARVRVVIEEMRLAADADELEDFKPKGEPTKMKLTDIPPDSEEDIARQKRAEEAKKAEAEEGDDEDDEDDEGDGEKAKDGGERAKDGATEDGEEDPIDPASPEGEAAAAKAAAEKKAAAPAVKTRKVYVLDGPFVANARSRKLTKQITTYRAMLEKTLVRGGYLFFGTGAKGYCRGRTSDAAAARELLKKLPEVMGRANDFEGFHNDLLTSGLMGYLTYQIARDLFRHKTDSVYLKQRRREIAEADKLNKMINSHER